MNRVMLLMSGGVDSSVAALLLKKSGYEVTGVTMNLQGKDNLKAQKEINDAKTVAKILDINHITVDLTNEFNDIIIKNFVNEYLYGKTPNPCVICNKYIKFGKMFELSMEKGFDYIATGHYAVVEYDKNFNRWNLKKSNSSKDQSYVLYNLNQEKLAHLLLPISTLEKEEIRKIARENNLPVADKKDSQEICFVQDNDYCKFIEDYTDIKPPKGSFINKDGNILGEHEGLIHYTIGQRKGLKISFGKPKYVISLNAKENTIVLGDEEDQYSKGLIAENVNCVFGSFDKETEVTAKIRYKSKPVIAKIIPINEDKIKVIFSQKQKSVTPGQSVVFYDGDIVLGGGIIKEKI